MAQWRQLHLHPGGGLVGLAEAQDAGGIVRVGAGEEFLRVGDAVAVAVDSQLASNQLLRIGKAMSAQEVIAEFKELPPAERAQVAKFVVEYDDSWIPDEFKEAMKDAEAGRLVEMETALSEIPPPHRR